MAVNRNDPDARFGDQVRRARERNGMTQKDVADALAALGWELDPTAITKIEKGTRSVRVPQIYLLASVLQVAPEQLLVDDEVTLRSFQAAVFSELRDARTAALRAAQTLRHIHAELAQDHDGGLLHSFGVGTPDQYLETVVDKVVLFRGMWDLNQGDAPRFAEPSIALVRRILEVAMSGVVMGAEDAERYEDIELSGEGHVDLEARSVDYITRHQATDPDDARAMLRNARDAANEAAQGVDAVDDAINLRASREGEGRGDG